MTNIDIKELSPSQDLKSYVHSYWSGSFNRLNKPDFSQSVVPSGLVNLIIHLTDDHCFLTRSNDDWSCSPDYTLIGMYQEPYTVRFNQEVEVFAVAFYPEGITNVFGISPSKFVATYEDSVDVIGREFRDLCHRMREAVDTPERIALMERYLREQSAGNKKDFDYVKLALETIRTHNGILDQAHLMREIPISIRQLQREFKRQFGITPKQYMRIARNNAIQKYMRNVDDVDFSDITYDHGFFDQAHFIREFKLFNGAPPKQFLKKRQRFIVNPLGQ